MRNFRILARVITFISIIFIAACGSEASPIRGIWTAPSGASIEITSNKWIGHAGPMQVNLTYTIQSTDGGKIVVALNDDSGKKPGSAILNVSGDVLTITGNSLWGGTWTRKK